MRFERVRLENFTCYADADLSLDRGVTVIHGVNGSGKSSLLEACFFALYGHRALDRTLEEVVTIGAEETTVELWFSHGGADFHLRRRVRLRGGGAQTVECVLEGPEGTVEGATDVRERVVELLRMDSAAFVNCAYVRQGEVNKLINASPGERQDMIDDLLQLGTLEKYRERASEARRGVGRVRRSKRELLEDRERRIEEAEDRDLHGRLNRLETRLAEVQANIEDREENREAAVETREQAEQILEESAERREELEALQSEIEELKGDIAEAEREREALGERLTERREAAAERRELIGEALAETEFSAARAADLERSAVEDRLAELREEKEAVRDRIEERRLEAQKHADAAESARERAEEHAAEAAEAREEADALEAELDESRADLAERRERVEALAERLEDEREAFADAPVELGDAGAHREAVAEGLATARERVAELATEVESARERVEEAEALLAAGKCPECGQDVEGAPHVDSVDDDREALADLEASLAAAREERDRRERRLERARELEAAEDRIEERRAERALAEQAVEDLAEDVAETEDRIEELRDAAEEHEAAAERKREAAAAAEERAAAARAAIGECNGESAAIDERIERIERLDGWLDDLAEAEADVERLRERRERLAEGAELRRERLAEKRDRKNELEAEFDESAVEHARSEKERAETFIERVDGVLGDLREERDELQAKVGAVENELEALAELREEAAALRETVERLDSLYGEATRLQEMYGELRAELRRRNVERLEALLNETFTLVYENDSYARIELDGEYELTVYQKDGEPLDPEQLSGGERALFNLSLRCAIYRLLAEGIEGAAPMPPLILDEPTVFLDSGHVSKLVELVDVMCDHGVEQIVVVSHDEELVGAADDLVTVSKDPTTNRSTVTRERAVGVPDAANADD